MSAGVPSAAGNKGYRFPFAPNPDGWFCVGASPDLETGEVWARSYFGRELVVFRGEDGSVSALDAFCPHMGAHLGHGGTVQGNDIRCPMHGFCFDGEGSCTRTGYGTKIPPKAKTRAWPVMERNGFILVWYAHDGRAPEWEVPEIDMTGWTVPLTEARPLRTHPQETSENSVDLGHFEIVHGYKDFGITTPCSTDGALLRIGYEMKRAADFMGMPDHYVDASFEVYVYGLGFSFVDVEIPEYGMFVRNFILPIPIDDERTEMRVGTSIKALPDPDATAQVAQVSFEGLLNDVSQDYAIWENKVYATRPALAEGDGPIGIYRRWCRQFYPPGEGREAPTPA